MLVLAAAASQFPIFTLKLDDETFYRDIDYDTKGDESSCSNLSLS